MGARHDRAARLPARGDRRALRLVPRRARLAAGGRADRLGQERDPRRVRPQRRGGLPRDPHPHRHPRARADRAEPRGADPALARRAGGHLLGRARQAPARAPGPRRRRPVGRAARPRPRACRSRHRRRGAPGAALERHPVRAAVRGAARHQPEPEGDRPHRDALSAGQRAAARGRERALRRHRLRHPHRHAGRARPPGAAHLQAPCSGVRHRRAAPPHGRVRRARDAGPLRRRRHPRRRRRDRRARPRPALLDRLLHLGRACAGGARRAARPRHRRRDGDRRDARARARPVPARLPRGPGAGADQRRAC